VNKIVTGEGKFWFQKRLVQRLEQKREEVFELVYQMGDEKLLLLYYTQ